MSSLPTIPPVAENDEQVRQLSITSLSTVDLPFCGVAQLNVVKPKPRRYPWYSQRLPNDGIEVIIQKTRAMGVGEEKLAADENGNEWLDALACGGERLIWGLRKIRKYVCGGISCHFDSDGSDSHAQELIEHRVLHRLLYFLDQTVPQDAMVSLLLI